MLVFTPLSVRLLGDAGIGWHIRTGQLILATHAIPRVDPFSSTMAGQPGLPGSGSTTCSSGWLDRAAGLNGGGAVHGIDDRDDFAWTFRLLPARGHKRSAGVDPGAAGGVGVDDSFSCAAACAELAVHGGVVLDSGFLGDRQTLF